MVDSFPNMLDGRVALRRVWSEQLAKVNVNVNVNVNV